MSKDHLLDYHGWNLVKRLSHCQCGRLTGGHRPGLFERLLMLLIPHFDIVKSPAIRSGGFTEVTCYLRRFYLFRSKWFGLEKYLGDLYLHHIVRSDDDPDPHDHPWGFLGFIIAGGYTDESYTWGPVLDGLYVRSGPINEAVRPRTFIRRPATHIHKVIVPPGKTVWTIIATQPRSREWNFVTPNGPILWRTYLGIPDNVDVGE